MPNLCIVNRTKQKAKEGLMLDYCKWKELQDMVTTKERMAKQVEDNANYIKERRDLSAKMQSEWDNTYVNMRKKRFEEMEARRAMAEAERERKYWKLRREEQALREEMTARAKYMLNQQKDYTKNINRALSLAEVLRERKAQVDFNNFLKQKEIEKEIEYAKSIKEDVEKYHQEVNEKGQKGLKQKEKLKQEILQTLKDAREAKVREQLQKKREGVEVLKRLKKEIIEQEEEEKKEKIRQREIAISNIEENMKMKEEYKKKLEKEDEEEDTKISIINEIKKRLNNERKRRDKEEQAANVARRAKIAMEVAAVVASNEEEENQRVEKALAEKDALAEAKAKKDTDYAARLRRERNEAHRDHLQEEEKKKQTEYEINKWLMLQRFKKDELNRKYDEDESDKVDESTKQSRIQWNKQIRERNDKEFKETEEDVDAMNRALQVWKDEDESNLKYADEIMEECKKVGRPTYPIEAVLQKYKKVIGALPKRPLSATWRSNIPIFNPAVEEEAEKRQINRPRITPKCACIPRNGLI